MKDKISRFALSEFTDIGQFFSQHIDDRISDTATIRMMPNDFARPVYSVIIEHLDELLPLAKPVLGTDGVYSLYDLNRILKDLQRKENAIRLKFMPALVKFEKLGIEHEEKLGIDALFEHYVKELKSVSKLPLTRDEFDRVMAFRNRLVHPTDKKKKLALGDADIEAVSAIFRRFGCLRML